MKQQIPAQKTKVFRVKLEFEKGKNFAEQCKNEKTNVNAKLKEMIDQSLEGNKKYFLSGKNVLEYSGSENNFIWKVVLDDGKEQIILKNLDLNFVKQLTDACFKAMADREAWVHGSKGVAIPKGLVK